MFIPLLPVPKVSPNYSDAAISFACRTSVLPSSSHTISLSLTSQLSVDTDVTSTSVHSYPPSPPTPSVVLSPPSPQSIDAKLEEIASPRTLAPPSKTPKQQVTHFLLAPHSSMHVPQPAESSFFMRALAAFKNSKPSHSSSFTLSPISLPPVSLPAPSPLSSANSANSHCIPHLPPRPKPLLIFHDRTPIMTVSSITGLLEIDEEEEKLLGVQTSFWITIALTYLEFLGERDVSQNYHLSRHYTTLTMSWFSGLSGCG